jgi:hypothetical protein
MIAEICVSVVAGVGGMETSKVKRIMILELWFWFRV